MLSDINLPLIMLAALIAALSPGPATLAIAGTSMQSGRKMGLALASGITTGSWLWSISAALGLGAIMLANAWIFEVMRYFGGGYLLFLAYSSAKSALSSKQTVATSIGARTLRGAFSRGLALHVTNPKAILFFGALFAIGVPPGSSPIALAVVILAVGLQSTIIFHGYAVLFSNPLMVRGYTRLRRWMEGIFAAAFGYAAFQIFTSRVT